MPWSALVFTYAKPGHFCAESATDLRRSCAESDTQLIPAIRWWDRIATIAHGATAEERGGAESGGRGPTIKSVLYETEKGAELLSAQKGALWPNLHAIVVLSHV